MKTMKASTKWIRKVKAAVLALESEYSCTPFGTRLLQIFSYVELVPGTGAKIEVFSVMLSIYRSF